jgi:SAM-dependent MidA family methyltransferase
MERLDAFMARANAAYYARHDPFADFTTAPEISQVFGEVLGAWAAVTWEVMRRPAPVVLAELGPGRGTLMADALRTIRRVAPAFASALSVHLVETSPRLREAQRARIGEAVWHEYLESLPEVPMILLANEFLDALPVRQFVRRGSGWAERYVRDGAFAEQPCPAPVTAEHPEGAVIERCEPALDLARALGRRFAATPGAALLLDYGPAARGPGESLQALRGGKPADPLAHPGEADLTAHVDFAALLAEAREAGGTGLGPVAQGVFLVRLGVLARAQALARNAGSVRQAASVMEAAQRLIEPTAMGSLFKAIAITDPAHGVPAGFAA